MSNYKLARVFGAAFAIVVSTNAWAQSGGGKSSVDYDRTPRPEARTGRGMEMPGEMPENSSRWKYSHTPSSARFGVSIGDQAGGPIRYNTRFPAAKSTSNPSSYYHTAAFASAEFEFALKNGGIIIGAHSRRDYAHKGIVSRTTQRDQQTWSVENFNFYDTGGVLGWAFGERYREAIWSADFAMIYDHGGVNIGLSRADYGGVSRARARIDAVSFRSRLHVTTGNSGMFQLSAGPEIHVPLWQGVTVDSDPELRGWVADRLDLKGSAALGLGVMSSVRF